MLNDPETRQVLKALTEAIEVGNLHSPSREIVEDAIALCEARLARVVEPVAWIGCNAITGKPFAQMPSDPRSDVCAPWIPAFATPQAAAQPSQAVELSDAEITDIAKTACAEGRLLWLGFDKDEDGRYTVPTLSPSDFKLVREVIAAINAKAVTP